MGTEIERKFLVRADGWRALAGETHRLRQGYLSRDPAREVRVRIVDDAEAWLTVKAKRPGPARAEFEYPVPVADARELLALCAARLRSRRTVTIYGSRPRASGSSMCTRTAMRA